ncbi:solute carrier organic anion transporter family member 4A1 [Parasteatoda tepidariorum]|uniref:solute carrier organic anion transporter family member 4A1 n=1 Tax=Parasteatoda tepidariorum TaxID=114398 RepID=UPI001C7232DD|nr:solute carrier organic anion transporter family member 4A1 [Parasteatoda tepidariorum]XP_042902252.1 solute carrier organic anion transporter family member 4A1 [Parasteatoda tepidariorum]
MTGANDSGLSPESDKACAYSISSSKSQLFLVKGDIGFEDTTSKANGSINSVSELSDSFTGTDKLCGWANFRPLCLQNCRTPRWFLFWICWAGALQGLIVNGFINVVITTIEKRYELKSTETGFIAGSYDIASFLCLIPITYLGGTRSKPFFLGSGLILLSFGSLVFSLPYFLAGTYTFSQEQDFHCHSGLQSANYTAVCSVAESSLSSYKYIFFIGQLLHGAGAVPLYTLGCTYLEENVSTKMSSMYLGIFYTMAIVGPALGYLLGGQMLRLYVDFGIDANELGLSPSSTVWVGAWWIGFVFAAVLGLLIAIPVLAFPKTLPSTDKVKAGKISEMHQKLQESDAARVDFGSSFSDLPSSLKLLITNPTFVFLSLAGASEGILLAGLATFLPKLIESQFSYQASFAAFIVGSVTIPGAGGGNLLGGYLVKRFKMKCASIIRMCIAFCLICLAFSFIFILHCPDSKFAGVNVNISDETMGSKFLSDCNSDCTCSDHNYDPICGADNTIYFSPCFAGCQTVYQENERKAYGSCSCIEHGGMNMTFRGTEYVVQATREKCDNNCTHGPLFLGVIFLCMFFTFLVSMPSLSATLRCVAESQKSFGLGIQWMAVRLLGTIPAPIFFGWLIDKSCILWQDSCDNDKGSCLFYNNEKMSSNILSIVCLVKILSCILFSMAWYTYRPPDTSRTVASDSACEPNSPQQSQSISKNIANEEQCVGIRFAPYQNEAFTSCDAHTSSVL